MSERLDGHSAVVTGAGSGIGRAIAIAFAAAGAKVVCTDINLPGAEETAAMAGGASATSHDVRDPGQWAGVLDAAPAGRLIVVNNAGIGAGEPITQMTDELWNAVIGTNLSGVFFGIRAGLRSMAERANGGCILNIASIAGIAAAPGFAAYGAAKAGVIHLTHIAAAEGAPLGVRVNAIAPGWTDTPMARAAAERMGGVERAFRQMSATSLAGRIARPDEIAAAALYLCSSAADYVTGIVLPVDGGSLIGRTAIEIPATGH